LEQEKNMPVNKENAILLCEVDAEDLWVCNGFVFRLDKKYSTYEDALLSIWTQINTPEFCWEVLKGNQFITAENKHEFSAYKCYHIGVSGGRLSFFFRDENKEYDVDDIYDNELVVDLTCHFVYLRN